LTVGGVVTPWLVHPDWTPDIHIKWLDAEGYDISRWEHSQQAIIELLPGLHTATPATTAASAVSGAEATAVDDADEFTAERWQEAARRARLRDRALLEDAFAGHMTPDVRRLFARVVEHLDRDGLLTLAGLPMRLRPTPTTTEPLDGPTAVTITATRDQLDLTAQATAAIAAYRDAFDEHLPVAEPGPGLQRSTVVADAGQRVLDVASIVTRRTVFAVSPTDHAYTLSIDPPETWTGYRSTFAVLLRRGELLLGFYDGASIHAFPDPEPVDVLVGGRVITVRTTTGRVLIMDSWVEVYRQHAESGDNGARQATVPALPASGAHTE
jgi:hypothetical protein